MRDLERFMVLQVVDVRWREHLENMDYMREGIHLRGMAQKDPLVEYRNEGHMMFQDLNTTIHREVVSLLFHTQVTPTDDQGNPLPPVSSAPNGGGGNGSNGGGALSYQHETAAGAQAIAAAGGGATAVAENGAAIQQPLVKAANQNVGRNDPCWCGSGKKFKRCHGA